MDTFLDFKFQKKRLLKNVSSLKKKEKDKIVETYRQAKRYHIKQKRDEGGPYILHCLRVASLLIEELDIKTGDVVYAAILHDSVEDTSLTFKDVKDGFGSRTYELVRNLTRKELSETELNKYQQKYKKFQEIMKKDFDTRAIKACDYLDNMMSWSYIPKGHPSRKKFPRWFREAQTMYIPLAESVDKGLVQKMGATLNKVEWTKCSQS